jgi:hypothetical protein
VAVGAYLFENWAENEWLKTYVASYFTRQIGGAYAFSPDQLEDLGYAQFAGGYATLALFGRGVFSTRNIARNSYWNFAPEVSRRTRTLDERTSPRDAPQLYQSSHFIDFMGNAIEQGYPDMNMSVSDGKTLLKLLSSSHEDGVAFRHFLIREHTTYRCSRPQQVSADT